MKLLTTLEDLAKLRNWEKANCECYSCKKSYLKSVKKIREELKLNTGEIKYCSHLCHSNGVKLRTKINCDYCKKEFEARPSKLKRKKNHIFCSRQCTANYYKENPKEINFKHRDKNYRYVIPEEMANRTLQYYWDKYKNVYSSWKNVSARGLCHTWNKHLKSLPCAICGYDKHVELSHIIPLSSMPGDTKLIDANSEKNIIQLCPNCHWEFDHGMISIEKILEKKSGN